MPKYNSFELSKLINSLKTELNDKTKSTDSGLKIDINLSFKVEIVEKDKSLKVYVANEGTVGIGILYDGGERDGFLLDDLNQTLNDGGGKEGSSLDDLNQRLEDGGGKDG